MRLSQLLLAASLLVSTGASASVLTGPVYNPATDHYYYLLTQNTWTNSESEAVSLGGHLATVNSAAENIWIYNTFSTFGGDNRHLWIGLYDPNQAVNSSNVLARRAEFVWVSGEPVTYSASWSPVEPNNPSSEYWVHIWGPDDGSAGFWNNLTNVASIRSGQPLNGVVEVATLIPEPSSLALLIAGVAGLGAARRRSRKGSSSSIDRL